MSYLLLLVVVNSLVDPAITSFALILTTTNHRLISAHGHFGDILLDRIMTRAVFRLVRLTFTDVMTLAVRLLHATLILLVLLVLTAGARDL